MRGREPPDRSGRGGKEPPDRPDRDAGSGAGEAGGQNANGIRILEGPAGGASRWLRPLAVAAVALVVERVVTRREALAPVLESLVGAGALSEGPLAAEAAFLLTLLLLGGTAVAGGLLLLGRTPLELGLRAGRVRTGSALLAVGIPVALVAGWVGSGSGALAGEYPLGEGLGPSFGVFLPYALTYVAYYLGYELFFRGYLLLGLEEVLGPGRANALQATVATVAHLGKPWLEVGAAFPASLLFGWVTLRTRSVWYAVAIHWAVGVALDWFLLVGG